MRRAGRFKICINAECLTWVPLCTQCGAEMKKKKGYNGEFWGCKNFRYEGVSCKHTESEIIFNKGLLVLANRKQ